jgi:polysaccharide biosynthesis transport protein
MVPGVADPAVQAPGPETPFQVLWVRRWIVLATALLGTVTAAVVSKSLDPVYSATAKLLVVQSSDTQTFDAVQAAQVSARTYADIVDSANTARQVASRLGPDVGVQDVRDATDFEPIPETQLLKITAERPTAQAAQAMANTYAEVFEAFARDRLRPATQTTVTIADRAALPSSPTRPKPTLYTLLAGMLSLGLGIALAFLRDRLDTRVESSDELEQTFGLPTLARVPRRGSSPEAAARFAEASRILRVAVMFATPGSPPKSIVLTSANEGEGKTTTARQLGLAFAEAGQHVILVEADVYRPALRRSLRLPEGGGGAGVTGYLLGQAGLDGVLETTAVPKLQVLSAGSAALSLASLMESERGRTFVEDLEARADIVIFDCPPSAPRADAAVLGAHADATILVIDTAVSDRAAIGEALRALRAVHANVVGVVLNRASAGAAYSAYYRTDAERQPGAATPA